MVVLARHMQNGSDTGASGGEPIAGQLSVDERRTVEIRLAAGVGTAPADSAPSLTPTTDTTTTTIGLPEIAERIDVLANLFAEAQRQLADLAASLRSIAAAQAQPAYQPSSAHRPAVPPPAPAASALAPKPAAVAAPAPTVSPTSVGSLAQASQAKKADPLSGIRDSIADTYGLNAQSNLAPRQTAFSVIAAEPLPLDRTRPLPDPVGAAALAPIASPPPLAPTAGANVANHIEALLPDYRALLARPRKADINSWIKAQAGQNCEFRDDNGLVLTVWDGSGLLVLVPIDDAVAIIVPGSRMVVEFATSFANLLSMRAVTRHAFHLSPDGLGALQLVSPALAEWVDGQWHLTQPGTLAGFTN